MVDVQQVTVEIKVAVTASLHGGIGWFRSTGAWWESQLCKYCKRSKSNLGKALGAVLGLVDDELERVGVGGLLPVRGDGGHCKSREAMFVSMARMGYQLKKIRKVLS